MTRSGRWARMAALACAGTGSFYAALHLGRPLGATLEASGQPSPARLAPHPERAVRTGEAATPVAAPGPASRAVLAPALVDRARAIPESKGDAFTRLSWLPPVPPPPPAPPPAAPPAPVVPPIPFAFVGMLETGGARPQAFLARGDALIVVAAGDTIEDGTYRIDSLSESRVVLTYLPMHIQQSISVAGGISK